MVMIGRAPKELTDLIRNNPVIDIAPTNLQEQIKNIKDNITAYQPLVDRHREIAQRLAPRELRMRQVKEWMEKM